MTRVRDAIGIWDLIYGIIYWYYGVTALGSSVLVAMMPTTRDADIYVCIGTGDKRACIGVGIQPLVFGPLGLIWEMRSVF